MNNYIGIIGCGWLGLPLAEALVLDGFNVKGSTTAENKLSILNNAGIAPYLISLSENSIEGDITNFLNGVKTLVLNVPPKLRGTNSENYVAKMQVLYFAIKKSEVKNIVFVSSTSVYGDIDGEVTEKTIPSPTTASGKQLLASENIFKNDPLLQTTIIRFGGLISEDRHPVTMLSKKDNLQNGNMPVNLIHRNDCIRIIELILKEGTWNVIINGVYPKHPTKKEYYKREAILRDLKPPVYIEDSTINGKIIIPEYLLNVKNFNFLTSIEN